MDKYFILKDKKPVKVDNVLIWARSYENKDRTVAKTELSEDIFISTVFLGINHNYEEGEPILFETMVFGGEHDGYTDRYTTWDEAEKGHKKAVELHK